jgi:hypothetical protein
MLARLFRVLLVCCLLLGLWGCPASPPAGIPAPVSELLAVGNPDTSGNVQITGAPGAVLGGAIVNSNNNMPTATLTLPKFILPNAHAAELLFDSTAANPDGSFTLTVNAKVGDVIQVTQTVDGKTSPPTDLLVNGDTVDLGFDGQDVDVDEFSGFVFSSAVNQAGLVFRLDFSMGSPPSLPPPYCTGLDPGITHLALDGPSGMGFVIAPDINGIYSFSLVRSCNPSFANLPNKPVDVTTDPVMPGVLVGLEAPSGSPSVISFPDAGTPPGCAIEIVHPAQASPMATTLLATGPSPFVFVVTQFTDGSIWATRLDVTPTCKSPVPAGILLPAGINPGGIAAVNANAAMISDANSNQAFLLDFVNRTITGQVTVGKNPQGIAVDPQANRGYVVNLGDNSISIIDLSNFSLLFSIPSVGLMPNTIDLIPGGGSAVVLSTFDDSVVFTDITP